MEDNPILKQVSESIDAAYNLGIDHALRIIKEEKAIEVSGGTVDVIMTNLINRISTLKKQ